MNTEKRKYYTEEQKEIKKFILVLIGLIVIIFGIYLLSKLLIKPSVKNYEYETGQINNTIAIVGTMLNKNEKEYYVLAYDTKSNNAAAYNTYAGYYTSSKENALKIYYLNLNNGLNKNYYVTENSNPKATSIKDLKMIDGTLLKIKDGKITKYIEGIDKIAEELKV